MNFLHLIFVVPEIYLLGMVCFTLIVSLFFERESTIAYYIAQMALIFTALMVMKFDTGSTHFAFSGQFILDHFAYMAKLFILGGVFLSFAYSRNYLRERGMPIAEFYVLGLLSTLGMMVLVSSNNLLVLYLGLELMSLPLYAMVALWRKRVQCVEAGMKYFVLGAIASGLLLYGISMIYGVAHTLSFHDIAGALAVHADHHLLLVLGLVFISAGVIFKLGAAPFHLWVPDVYDGAPTVTTLFISAAPKLAAFAMIVRLFDNMLPSMMIQWHMILMVVAILSLTIGNLVALTQQSIKRMLAYSSIAHMGYMLLGFVAGTIAGMHAALFYMVSYMIMSLAALGLLSLMSRNGLEIQTIDDLAGMNTHAPWLAFLFLLVMFSMAGIPPMLGFMAKLTVFEALISAGMTWLAVVAVIFAVIASYYYLRVVKTMYFDDAKPAKISLCYAWDERALVTINALAVLLLGIFPSSLITLCQHIF